MVLFRGREYLPAGSPVRSAEIVARRPLRSVFEKGDMRWHWTPAAPRRIQLFLNAL